MGRSACTEPQCLYSTAIPLLPLRAVQPVQNLSACTVQLHLYSPYGPYNLYRASVPVQGRTLPLYLTGDGSALCLPLDAVQSHKAQSAPPTHSPPLTLTCTQIHPIMFWRCESYILTYRYAIDGELSHGLQQYLLTGTCNEAPCRGTMGSQLVCERNRTPFIHAEN